MTPVRTSNGSSQERGIALVAAVLVVLLSTMLVAAFMSTTTGERAMSSNVQIAKASLYAADAGVRTEQQQLANLAFVKMDSCATNWSGTGMVIAHPENLFPAGTFSVTSSNPPFTATGTITYSDTTITPGAQAYDYRFTIQSQGAVASSGLRRVQASGNLRVSAQRGSFADYLIFMGHQMNASGSNIWFTSSVTYDGRVHANDQMHFAFKPTFYDAVSTTAANALFNNGGSPVTLAASNNGTIDVPNFFNGFYRGQPSVPLPTNAFNQQTASLGITGVPVGTAPSNLQINAAIGNTSGPTMPPPNGIYVPNTGGVISGGFYVQGDLSTCRMWADTTTNRQWYQLVQGGTTKTILVDRAANQTKVWNSASTTGSPTSTYTGYPNNSVLYVTGGIGDLRGPDRAGGQVLPAIAENTQLLIAAAGDIVIQRDVTCDSYNSNTNVLGLFTTNGKVRIGTSAPNDMNLDAFVMATNATAGEFMVDNYNSGSSRGTFHLRGGIVEQYYGAFFTFNSSTGAQLTGFARDFHYDKRGLIPPYYPTTTRFNANLPSARTLSWKEI
jgi:Tfp pilus assembly protein PilX